MSTSIIADSIVISSGPDGLVDHISGQTNDVYSAECECCGLTEECTVSYVETIRQRYGGKWICGLCAEAVKYEILRSSTQKLISPDEALDRHFSFCNKFKASGPPQDPTVHLIRAMSQLLRKSLESPKSVRSMPTSPMNKSNRREFGINDDNENGVLTQSESCIPSITLVEASVYCSVEEGCEM